MVATKIPAIGRSLGKKGKILGRFFDTGDISVLGQEPSGPFRSLNQLIITVRSSCSQEKKCTEEK